MAGLIDRIGSVKLRPRRLPPFQSLTHAIIHQQLNGKAAGTILARFLALLAATISPRQRRWKASPERLRSAGLSRPKATYVLGIAQQAADGHIPTLDECDRLSDAEIVERLISIKGWAGGPPRCCLIFNFGAGRLPPVQHLGVRKGFQFAYAKRKLPEPDKLALYGVSLGALPHGRRVVSVEGRRFPERGGLVNGEVTFLSTR